MKHYSSIILFIAFFIGVIFGGEVRATEEGMFFNPAPVACKLPRLARMSPKQWSDLKDHWDEQTRSMTPKQRKMWKKLSVILDPEWVLPDFLLDLNVEKINFSGEYTASIPFKSCPDKGFSTYPQNRIYMSGKLIPEHIVPTHEMDGFIRYKQNCFFIPQPGDEALPSEEREFVRTLDKCLNWIFAFIYARPCSNMDKKMLESGAYSGLVHEVFLLTRINKPVEQWTSREKMEQKKRRNKFFKFWGINGLQIVALPYRSFEEFKKNHPEIQARHSHTENMIFMYLGYPLTIRAGFELGAGFRVGLWESMCEAGQKCVRQNTYGQDIFTVETVGNIEKRKAQGVSNVLLVDALCKRYDERFNKAVYCTAILNEEAIRMLIMDHGKFDPCKVNDAAALNPFQKALLKRHETLRNYDRKLEAYALSKNPAPKSLSHTKLLNRELQENYDQLQAMAKTGGNPPSQSSPQPRE